MVYTFTNLIKKGDSVYYTNKSGDKVIGLQTVGDESDIPLLEENLPTGGVSRSITAGISSPEDSTITGKVLLVCCINYTKVIDLFM